MFKWTTHTNGLKKCLANEENCFKYREKDFSIEQKCNFSKKKESNEKNVLPGKLWFPVKIQLNAKLKLHFDVSMVFLLLKYTEQQLKYKSSVTIILRSTVS